MKPLNINNTLYKIFILSIIMLSLLSMGVKDTIAQHLGDLGKPDDYEETIKNFRQVYYYFNNFVDQLPEAFDWRDEGVVTDAKDQGRCGSCWAFAAVGVLEAKILMHGGPLFDLSEQQQVSCNMSMYGCKGGRMTALKYWYYIGPMKENCTGYDDYNTTIFTDTNVPCDDIDMCGELPYRTTGYYTVNTSDIDEIKASLYIDGPAFFSFIVCSDFIDWWITTADPGAVYTQSSGYYLGGHAVLIIGWDDNRGAWLCKNSWGSTDGPNGDGTFWIAYSGHANDLKFAMANVEIVKTSDMWVDSYAYGNFPDLWRVDKHPRIMADVNNDDMADVVGFFNSGVYVSLSDGNKFSTPELWVPDYGCNAGWRVEDHPRIMADVNKDNMADVVGFFNSGVYVSLSDGTKFSTPKLWVSGFGYNAGWRVKYHPRMLADVNNDDMVDVVGFSNSGVYVSLSDGTKFSTPELWVPDYGYNMGWRVGYHPRMLADVNADGMADVVGYSSSGVYVSLSDGTKFSTPELWLPIPNYKYSPSPGPSPSVESYPLIMVTDVNADDMADVVRFSNSGVYVSLSDGTKFSTPELWVSDYGYNAGWRMDKHPRMMADVNKDDMADVVGFFNSGVYVSLSDGTKFSTPELWVPDYGYANSAGSWRIEKHPRMMADVNADGMADVIGFGDRGVYVSVSDGISTFKSSRFFYGGHYPNLQSTFLTWNMDLQAGWNMISLPVIPHSASVSDVFPDAKVVYSCEEGAGYVRVKDGDDLKIGKGYWILLDKAKIFTIRGMAFDEYTHTVSESGWLMIGGCSSTSYITVDNCSIGVIYGYAPGIGYQRIQKNESLQAGKGYFILLEDVDHSNLTVRSK